MWQWLRHRFLAGFFVTVPLVVSVVAVVWIFRFADGLISRLVPLISNLFPQSALVQWLLAVPGLGLLATAAIVLAAGVLATNVFGRRLVERIERLLLHVPLFRTVYAPVRQLLTAFSPDSEVGFKRIVLVEDGRRGYMVGFLTKEFVVERGHGQERLLAVYVPTNHLYLGDVVVCPPERVIFPDLTVEDGVRVFLTGGMALPNRVSTGAASPGSAPEA